MVKAKQAVPDGYRSVTPYLVVRGAAAAVEFYKRAFDAQEISRTPGPGGLLLHAALRIGDSMIMLCDELPMMRRWVSPQSLNGTTMAVHLYVEDADGLFARAVAAGAAVSMPLLDAFWGDRFGKLADPFGHEWTIATHKFDYTPEEMRRAAEAFFANLHPAP